MSSDTRLLLGDEALAQGALDAGISGCYAYPGTPSTEIMEFIQRCPERRERPLHAQWSVNEKTAMEAGLGMSYAGRRAIVCMKHVGLNVAADAFINAGVTGVNGGLVVVVADDPSMHSSQNEQDSRFYAKFALVPCLEPATQQEAYDMAGYGLALSEELRLPVLLRLATRLAHSRADVRPGPRRAPNDLAMPADARRFVLLPGNARRNYAALVARQPELVKAAQTGFTEFRPGPDRSLGILAAGLTLNYLYESFPGGACPHPLLKVGQYPVPPDLLRQLLDSCDRVLVLEDGMPLLEESLRGPLGDDARILGRLSGQLPRTGELSPDTVAAALGRPPAAARPASSLAVARPPRLCDGCPHIDSYKALQAALADSPASRVFADIGCYTLGALPPFEAIHSCVDMGASISMAKGAADAGLHPAVAVIGDSTFTHSGMTSLLDAVVENTRMTVLILDNGTTGMTGGQASAASGRLDALVAGLGIPAANLQVITPLPKQHAANVAALRHAIFDTQGPAVVIARRECIQTAKTQKK
ncbi:MAG: indolepyruvate ferredoxin oxidoreductase subunit alpha [Lentisphaeria bacterium]